LVRAWPVAAAGMAAPEKGHLVSVVIVAPCRW
jgi:hypothetical protein